MVLNATEVRIASVTKCVLVFKACQAVVEGPTKAISGIHADVLVQFTTLVNDFDDPNLFASQLDIGRVRETKFELFLVSLKTAYTNGKKIWDKFKNMKSLLVNHCNCHYNVPSGWNVEMAQSACKDKLFLHCRNKQVIAKNKKLDEESQLDLLGEGDVDKDWFSAEWCMWKITFDSVLFTSLRNPKGSVPVDGEMDSEGEGDGSNEDMPAKKRLVMVKKRLKSIINKSPSRKKQKEATMKRKEKFNDTKEKNKEKKQLIEETNKNQFMITKTLAFKNNIEFVKLLNDGGTEVSDDRRKQIMDVTFQSFIEQNGIKASSEVVSKKKGSVEDDRTKGSVSKGSVSIKEIEIDNSSSNDEDFQSVIQSILGDDEDEDNNDCEIIKDVNDQSNDKDVNNNDNVNDKDKEEMNDESNDDEVEAHTYAEIGLPSPRRKEDEDDEEDDTDTELEEQDAIVKRYNLRSA